MISLCSRSKQWRLKVDTLVLIVDTIQLTKSQKRTLYHPKINYVAKQKIDDDEIQVNLRLNQTEMFNLDRAVLGLFLLIVVILFYDSSELFLPVFVSTAIPFIFFPVLQLSRQSASWINLVVIIITHFVIPLGVIYLIGGGIESPLFLNYFLAAFITIMVIAIINTNFVKGGIRARYLSKHHITFSMTGIVIDPAQYEKDDLKEIMVQSLSSESYRSTDARLSRSYHALISIKEIMMEEFITQCSHTGQIPIAWSYNKKLSLYNKCQKEQPLRNIDLSSDENHVQYVEGFETSQGAITQQDSEEKINEKISMIVDNPTTHQDVKYTVLYQFRNLSLESRRVLIEILGNLILNLKKKGNH